MRKSGDCIVMTCITTVMGSNYIWTWNEQRGKGRSSKVNKNWRLKTDHLRCINYISGLKAGGILLSCSSSSSYWGNREKSWKGCMLCDDEGAVCITRSKPGLKLLIIRLVDADELFEYAGCSPILMFGCCSCCCCCVLSRALAYAILPFITWVCVIATSACKDATWNRPNKWIFIDD